MQYEDPENRMPITDIAWNLTPEQIERAAEYYDGWRVLTDDGFNSSIIRGKVVQPFGAPYTEAIYEICNVLKSLEKEVIRLQHRVRELENNG